MTEPIEIASVVVGIMVIAIELVILSRLRQHRMEIDGHTRRLDEHIQDLDEHSRRLEKQVERLLKETEDIYTRVCRPLSVK
ncbi:MAG: hypothetical protein ABIH11_06720 [Candidatus Altiarchaeota archaeon]